MRATLLTVLLSASLFALPLALPAWADMKGKGCEDHGMMHGDGMGMGGMGMGMGSGGCDACGEMMDGSGGEGFIGLGHVRMMDLNADQRARLNKIQNDLRKQQWGLMGRILDERARLTDLYAMDRPDPKKIGQVYAAIFDLRRQMIEARIDAANRGRDLLTKEQLDKLRQLMQSRSGWGAAGGPHHGMMMQDMMGSSGSTQ